MTRALKHGNAVISRRHSVSIKKCELVCACTLPLCCRDVSSVAFHPSAPYVETGSWDNTAKLWPLNADCSAATCVSTLREHRDHVHSVVFHPSAPYLMTCSV